MGLPTTSRRRTKITKVTMGDPVVVMMEMVLYDNNNVKKDMTGTCHLNEVQTKLTIVMHMRRNARIGSRSTTKEPINTRINPRISEKTEIKSDIYQNSNIVHDNF